MSKEVDASDNKEVEVIAQDAVVVDERTAELVASIAEKTEKIKAALQKKKYDDGTAEPSSKKKQPVGDVVELSDDGADEPAELTQVQKDRAKEAGLTDALAERLHASGLLEESLAALDLQAISKSAKAGEQEPSPKESKPKRKTKGADAEEDLEDVTDDDIPALDPDAFDEALIKRDRFTQKRIGQLEKIVERQIAMIEQMAAGAQQQSASVAKQWTDKTAESLNKELFGKGDAGAANREKLFDGYRKICQVYGAAAEDCNEQLLQRAYSAVFYEHVFKAAQRKTVQELRDAQGKFVRPTRSTGAPPGNKPKSVDDIKEATRLKVEGR